MKNQTKSGKAPTKKEQADSSKKKTAQTTANKKSHTPGANEEKDIQPNRGEQDNLILKNPQPINSNEDRITNEDQKIVNEDGDYDFFDPTTLIMYIGNIL